MFDIKPEGLPWISPWNHHEIHQKSPGQEALVELLKNAKPKVHEVIPPPEDRKKTLGKPWEKQGESGCCCFFTKDVR